MQQQNLFLAFLVELFQRLRTTKPKFFTYFQWGVGAITAVTGFPAFLHLMFPNLILPVPVATLESKIVAACTAGAWLASQLTSASPVTTVTKDGIPLKQTDAKSLPFTAEIEVKKAQVDQIPNSSVTLEEVKK